LAFLATPQKASYVCDFPLKFMFFNYACRNSLVGSHINIYNVNSLLPFLFSSPPLSPHTFRKQNALCCCARKREMGGRASWSCVLIMITVNALPLPPFLFPFPTTRFFQWAIVFAVFPPPLLPPPPFRLTFFVAGL